MKGVFIITNNLLNTFKNMGHDNKKYVWLDSILYVKKIFAPKTNELWTDSVTFISVFNQGQNLLQSDILHINATDFYTAALNKNQDVWISLKKKKPRIIVKQLLNWKEPIDLLIEVLKGIKITYPTIPIIMEINSPKKWIKLISKLSDQEVNITFDELEIISMYLTKNLREFSMSGISGIVLSEENNNDSNDNHLESYKPINNIANHFEWLSGMYYNNNCINMRGIESFDFCIFDNNGYTDIQTMRKKGILSYGGLNNEFWLGNSAHFLEKESGLFFGRIPEESNPEMVLSQLKLL